MGNLLVQRKLEEERQRQAEEAARVDENGNLITTPVSSGGLADMIEGDAGSIVNNAIRAGQSNSDKASVGISLGNNAGAFNTDKNAYAVGQESSNFGKDSTNFNNTNTSNTQDTNTNVSSNVNTQGVEQTTQNRDTSNVVTTEKNDTLGLGDMVADAGALGATADQTRVDALSGIASGNEGIQRQTNQAVTNALSGPGMVGAGDAARARAAAGAAAQVGLNDTNQRIAAAQGLDTGGAAAKVVGAGTNLLGETVAGTGSENLTGQAVTDNTTVGSENTIGTVTNTGNQSSTGGASESGFSDVFSENVASENTSGTSVSESAKVSSGKSPQQTTEGGSYICTACVSFGLIRASDVRRSIEYTMRNYHKYKDVFLGYNLYGPTIMKFTARHKWFAKLIAPFARLCIYDQHARAGYKRRRLLPALANAAFVSINKFITTLGFGREEVSDEVKSFLESQNLLFKKEEV